MGLLGTPTAVEGSLTEQDVDAMKRIAGVLDSGFPLVALLQLIRVYAQSIRKIAEAEVRLFHLFVHEPLIAEGVDALQMAEEMEGLARDLFPSAAPLMSYIHNRYLRFYTEQDVVGHMEAELDGSRQLGRVMMTFCFVDLTGFTRFTEEEGDEEALDLVERFVDTVEATLPFRSARREDDRRRGDDRLAGSGDADRVVRWIPRPVLRAVPAARRASTWGAPYIATATTSAGDVNLTHRVVARALGGEVIITRAVADAIGNSEYLELEPIGKVGLKGFPEPIELYTVAVRPLE